MSHTCHAPDCTRQVPPKMFACREHWFRLPKNIRDAIWREYRDGQEIDKKPSVRYLAVQRFACYRLAFRPNDEKSKQVAADCLFEAMTYQKAAIMAGMGDPLEGILPTSMLPPKKKRAAT